MTIRVAGCFVKGATTSKTWRPIGLVKVVEGEPSALPLMRAVTPVPSRVTRSAFDTRAAAVPHPRDDVSRSLP